MVNGRTGSLRRRYIVGGGSDVAEPQIVINSMERCVVISRLGNRTKYFSTSLDSISHISTVAVVQGPTHEAKPETLRGDSSMET
jgi:hypothetical protein